jgi:transposase
MLDEPTRTAILKLHEQGHGSRMIARTLGAARSTIRRVLSSGQALVPSLGRIERADPWREAILELHTRYEGHLGRIHDSLLERGAQLSYPALTAFCRKHGIGSVPPLPAGRYEFCAGSEMQHDTSPHHARIAGVLTRVQTASVVLCYSRMIFFQMYPRFTRFECKAFLAQAINYFHGTARSCMVDNSNVVVAAGTGAEMIPAPEMVAFAERYGFVWRAHEKGDANRSARVEAPFHRIERGFLTGEDFADWADLNHRARQTCELWNAKFSSKLHASRRELFAAEQPHLLPLPLHVPEVYQLSSRIVDAEGFVNVNRIRYSVPYQLIGRTLEVRETLDRVDLYAGPRRVATHMRTYGEADTRITDPAHRPPRGQGLTRRPQVAPEETLILQIEPALGTYLQGLKQYVSNRRAPLRRLLAMVQEYPRKAFLSALANAERYRLFDLDRLERMVLRQIADDYFVLPPQLDPSEPNDE